MKKADWKKIKSILMLVLAFFEIILATLFLILYLLEKEGGSLKDALSIMSVMLYVVGSITIAYNEYGDKVISVAKKVGKIIISVTFGLVFRAFDALFNMATGERSSDLKAIKGYKDNEISIKKQNRKKKARYKSYRTMNNREKVQFLYYKTVSKAVRKGFFFKGSDTPREVDNKMVKAKYMKASDGILGDIYGISKYNDGAVITNEMVEAMKETC